MGWSPEYASDIWAKGVVSVGLAIYVEDQNHRRLGEADARLGSLLLIFREESAPHDLLRTIDTYGDTMFNLLQISRLIDEVEGIASRVGALSVEGEELTAKLEEILKSRGYIWIAGD
jgi:hypothetical protein